MKKTIYKIIKSIQILGLGFMLWIGNSYAFTPPPAGCTPGSCNIPLSMDFANQRVGIGTTSPGGILDVRGILSLFGSGQGYTYISDNSLNFRYDLNNDTNAGGWINYYGYNNGATRFRDLYIGNGKQSAIAFFQGSTGNVGIGTNTPSYKLDVQNGQINSSGGLCIAGDCKTSWASASQWITSGSDVYYNSGKVGIGTTSPSSLLSVNGIIDQQSSNNPTLSKHFTGVQTFNYTSSGEIRKILQFTNVDNSSKSGVIFGTVTLTFAGMETANANPAINVRKYNVRVRDWYSGAAYPMTAYMESIYEEGGQNKIVLDVDSATNTTLVLKAKVPQFNVFDSTSQLTVSFDFTSTAIQAGNFITPSFANGETTTGEPATQGTTILASSEGNVGIGTLTPGTKLEVSGTAGVNNPEIAITGPISGTPVLSMLGTPGSQPIIGFSPSGILRIGSITGLNGAGFSEKVRISSNGNVGIGTTTPGASVIMSGGLDINGTSSTQLVVQKNGTPGFALNIEDSGKWVMHDYVGGGWHSGLTQYNGNVGIGTTSTGTAKLVVSDTASTAFYMGSDARYLQLNYGDGKAWAFGNNNMEAPTNNFVFNYWNGSDWTKSVLSLSTSGKVGIGTNSPETGLDVNTTLRVKTWIAGDSSTGMLSLYGDIQTSEGNGMFIKDTGNVGIGTTNPSAKLDVKGSLLLSDDYYNIIYTSGNNLSFSLGSEAWAKLATFANVSHARIRLFIGSQNSEEESEIEMACTYVTSLCKIDVTRQSYNTRLREVRITGENGGNKSLYIKIRTSDYAPTIRWRVIEGNNFASIDNILEDPGSGSTLEVSNGQRSISTNSSMMIAGDVGIGTTSPSEKLDVAGDIKASGYGVFPGGITGANAGSPDSTIWTISGDQYNNWGIFYNEGSPDYIEFKTGGTVSSQIALDTGAAHFGLNGGNVGIGTTSPSQKLEVSGTVKATAFQGDGSGLTGLVVTEEDPQVGTLTSGKYCTSNGSAVNCTSTLGTASTVDTGTSVGQVPVLGAGGKLNDSIIPAIAISDTFVIASQAEQIALTAEVGDVAIRTDESKSYILKTAPSSTFANWSELKSPTDAVSSVFGRTGVVTAQSGDYTKTQVGLGNVDNTSDANKPISTATQSALDLKAPIASPTFTGTVSGITSSMVGLGNVENKSSATIRGEITSSNVTTALGYSPLSQDYLNGRVLGNADAADAYGISAYYSSSGAANKPTGFDHALLTLSFSDLWSVQMAGDWRTNNWYTRNQENGTWGSWATLWSSANLTNLNQLTNGPGYITSAGTSTNFSGSLVGDVTGTQGATVVGDDSHYHTSSTVYGLGVGDFTSAGISQWTNDSGYITSAGTSTNFSGSLVGDVTGTQGATVVGDDSHNHTSSTISGIGVGDFASSNISQWTNDSGYITSAGTSTNFSGSLVGDVTGTQGATVVGDDSHNHTSSTISGIGVGDFASSNISQWTNDSGYVTSGSNPSFAAVYASNWFRSTGNTGWYSETYGGGLYMEDSSWVRTYNDKSVWAGSGILGSNGGLTIGYGGASPNTGGGAIISGSVGIGTNLPTTKLSIAGDMNVKTASSGTSYKLYFGDEVTSGPGKAIFLEDYYMKIQGHRNEGIRLQGVNASGVVQEFATFYGDNNAKASQIHLAPNGGNVGIGTTSPGYRLDVSSVGTEAVARFGTSAADVVIGSNGILRSGESLFKIRGTSGIPLSLGAGGVDDYVRITTAGNVGIGTTTPTSGYKLDVNGHIRLSNSSPMIVGNSTLSFYGDTTSTLGMTLLTNGYVGIGTSPVNSKLQVETPEGVWGVTLVRSGTLVGGLHSNAGILALQAATGGAYLAMANNGSVGIGTSTPATALDVNGVITATGGNSTNWNAASANSHSALTIGTANGLSLSTQALSLGTASTSTTGALTSTDWNTFNNKQPAGSYEVNTNKASDFSTVNNTLYPTVQATKTYADSLVVGLLDDRGNYDASGNTFPTTGGSGTAGAVMKGDLWYVSVSGALGGTAVAVGDSFRALQDSPGQTASKWSVLEANIGYVPENATNKVTSISGASTDTQYPSAKLTYDQLALKAPINSPTFTGTVSGITSSMVGLGNVENKSSATIRGEITSSNVTTALNYTPLSADYLSGRSLADANNSDTAGVTAYYIGGSNKPTGTDHALLSLNYSSDWSMQMAGDWRTNNWYTRNQSNGIWGNWATLWSSANDGSGSGLDSDTLDGLSSASFDQSNTNEIQTLGTSGNDITLTSGGSVTAPYASTAPWSGITGRPTWLSGGSYIETQSDANAAVNSGFYENAGGGSNWPSQTWYNSINVRHSNQGNYHGFQIAMSYYDNLLWWRSYKGGIPGTFEPWVYGISSANIGSQTVANFSGSLVGDVTGTQGATVVGDDSHYHTSSTIYGLGVGDFTSAGISQWTNDSGYITSAGTSTNFSGSLNGDVTGTQGATVVGDDSHNHTSSTISGIGVGDFASSNISQWTNDSGYVGATNPYYYVTSGNGYGVCFWQDCSNYKIHMGTGAEYSYGPVTEYAIKSNMGAGTTGRGWVWGGTGVAPVAAINVSGNMQIAGQMTATQFNGSGAGLTGTASNLSIGGNAATLTNFTSNPNRNDSNDYSLAGRTQGIYAIAGAGTNGPGTSYLNLIHAANATDVAFQIAGGYVSDNMYFRGTSALQNGTGYTPWRTVIHSGNIGSQSVSYASSAGSSTNFSGSLSGDVTGTQGATAVGDDSHYHTSSTVYGLGVGDFTSAGISQWTNDSGYITSAGTSTNFSGSLSGDVTGTQGATAVGDDSHNHTPSTISGLGVGDFASPNISQWTNNSGYLTVESDPEVGSNTTNYLSKWDGSALIASTVSDSGGVVSTTSRVGIGASAANVSLYSKGSSTDSSHYGLAVANSSGTQNFVVRDDGNVGIGTTSPTKKLYVAGDVLIRPSIATNPTFTLMPKTGAIGTQAVISLYNTDLETDSSNWERLFITSNSGGAYAFTSQKSGTGVVRDIAFMGGNVGIGTTSPKKNLHVAGNVRIRPSIATNPNLELMPMTGAIGEQAVILLYNTDFETDSSNWERLFIASNSGGAYSFTSQKSGTGVARNIAFMGSNVGIGTTSPGEKLEIDGALKIGTIRLLRDSGDYSRLMFQPTTLNGPGNVSIIPNGTGNTGLEVYKTDMNADRVNTESLRILGDNSNNQYAIYTTANGSGQLRDIVFGQGSNIVMSLETNGNVGIGSTSPSAKLQVGAGNTNEPGTPGTLVPTVRIVGANNNTTDNSILRLVRDTNSTNLYGSVVDFKMKSYGTFGDPYLPKTQFTIALKSASGYAENADVDVLTLRDNGNVGIGTDSPSYLLHVNGTAGKPGGGSWSDSSDIRLKKNIKNISGKEALEKLTSLQGVKYEWKNPEEHSYGIKAGVIAQDLEKVFPDWVTKTDPKGKDKSLIPDGEKAKAISFPHDFNAYLIEAIKELKSEKDSEIAELKSIVCLDHPNIKYCK